MTSTLFAMDTSFFGSLGAYGFDARFEMLRELGYDATYLTVWNEVAWQDLPRLTTFPAFHWHAVEGTDLSGRLAEAAPYLALVSILGSRSYKSGSAWTTASWTSSPR